MTTTQDLEISNLDLNFDNITENQPQKDTNISDLSDVLMDVNINNLQ
jgi:hypothetical protein